MDELIRDFENKMHLEGKSDKTIKSYTASVSEFFRWFNDSFGGVGFKKLYSDTESSKAFADGTVPGHPELRQLQPGDKEYDNFMKMQKYFEQNTFALIHNTNMLEKQYENLIRDARNISNNVVNNQQRVVNQTINVSLPNVTDNTSATVLLNDLKSISTKKLQYNWGK